MNPAHPEHHMLAKLTFAAVRSCAYASRVAERMKLAAIVRATNQSRTATFPIVVWITVCRMHYDEVIVVIPRQTNREQ